MNVNLKKIILDFFNSGNFDQQFLNISFDKNATNYDLCLTDEEYKNMFKIIINKNEILNKEELVNHYFVKK